MERKANSNKATHEGTCQICGRRQKLPNGLLAKHGYTTRWGFFAGTCPGSEHLPYELDASMIEGAVRVLNAKAARLVVEAAELEGRTGRLARLTHKDCFGIVTLHDVELADDLSFFHPVTKKTQKLRFGFPTPEMAASSMNRTAAKNLKVEVAQIREFVQEAEERLRTWEPRPENLREVK